MFLSLRLCSTVSIIWTFNIENIVLHNSLLSRCVQILKLSHHHRQGLFFCLCLSYLQLSLRASLLGLETLAEYLSSSSSSDLLTNQNFLVISTTRYKFMAAYYVVAELYLQYWLQCIFIVLCIGPSMLPEHLLPIEDFLSLFTIYEQLEHIHQRYEPRQCLLVCRQNVEYPILKGFVRSYYSIL